MCGLAGYATTGRMAANEMALVEKTFIMQFPRGVHSSGFFATSALSPPGETAVWWNKEIRNPYSMVQHSKLYHSLRDRAINTVAFHNRHATRGEIKVENAHPFVSRCGSVVGMHNGTLTGTWKFQKDFEVDSEALINILAEAGPNEVEEALKGIEGAYALVWFDQRDEKIKIIRNKERTLFVTKFFSNLMWSSEEGPLYQHHTGFRDMVGNTKELTPHTLLSFTPGKTREISMEHLKGLEAPKVNYYTSRNFREHLREEFQEELSPYEEWLYAYGPSSPLSSRKEKGLEKPEGVGKKLEKGGSVTPLKPFLTPFMDENEEDSGYMQGIFNADYNEEQRFCYETNVVEINMKQSNGTDYWVPLQWFEDNVVLTGQCAYCEKAYIDFPSSVRKIYLSKTGEFSCLGQDDCLRVHLNDSMSEPTDMRKEA